MPFMCEDLRLRLTHARAHTHKLQSEDSANQGHVHLISYIVVDKTSDYLVSIQNIQFPISLHNSKFSQSGHCGSVDVIRKDSTPTHHIWLVLPTSTSVWIHKCVGHL